MTEGIMGDGLTSSVETKVAEIATPEAKEPTRLWYHCTSSLNLKSIEANGLQKSYVGKLGPGVYISDKPIRPDDPERSSVQLKLELQKETNLLPVSWDRTTNPFKIITGLYGEDGKKLLKKADQMDNRSTWLYMHELAINKGYGGLLFTDPADEFTQAVIFDPKKISLAEPPTMEP